MQWREKTGRHRHQEHRPVLDRQVLSISLFESDVLTGYREMAALLESPGGRFHALREEVFEAAARRVKRPTLIYGLLLRRSLEPAVLSSGIDRSIELMALPCAAQDPDWPGEIMSLERLDVPYFYYPPGAKPAPTEAGAIPPTLGPGRQEQMVRSAVRREVRLHEGKIAVRRRAGTITAGP